MTHHFKEHETACNCGCGENNMSELTLSMFDTARELAGVSFVVTSACRCEYHNKEVGGVHSSSHLSGLEYSIECEAMDVQAKDSTTRFKIVRALILVGFTRIGIGKTFIHADNDKSKSQEVMWLY